MSGDVARVSTAEFRGYRMRRVRRLACEAMAEAGIETVEYADRLEAADGRIFGLHNVFAACRTAPEVTWPQIVGERVRILVGMDAPAHLAALTREDALRGVYPRLVNRHVLESMPEGYAYARAVGDELAEILVLEIGTTVAWLRDPDVERFGPADLARAARENLLRSPRPSQRMLALLHGANIHVLAGGGHTASTVLLLPDVLQRVLGHADVPHGVLVAVPTKYDLWLHPVVDYRAYAAYVGLHDEAIRGAYEDPGGLSPYVYWWRDDELVQIMTERGGLPYPDDAFIKTVAGVAQADERAAMALLAELGRRDRPARERR